MLAFGEHHTYRVAPKDDPNAPQPIPSTRDLMGLTDKGAGKDEISDENVNPVEDIEVGDLKRKRKESGAVGHEHDPTALCQQHVTLKQIDGNSHKFAKLSVVDTVLQK